MKKRYSNSLVKGLCIFLVAGPLLAMASNTKSLKRSAPIMTEGRPGTSTRKSGKETRTPIRPMAQMSGLIAGQTATQLPDGRWLLIGGEGQDGPLATALVKDPNSGVVITLGSKLKFSRAWHSATMLPDGNILVCGGIGRDGKVVDAVELFNPDTQQFALLPVNDLAPRAYHTATLLIDGQVLFVGGVLRDSRPAGAELWNSKTRLSRQLIATTSEARQKHMAKLLADGNVLFWGGTSQSGVGTEGGEQFDVHSQSFRWSEVSDDQAQNSVPYLAESLPADGATNVSRETRIALRFSKPLRAETVNSSNVKLTGSQGAVPANIIPAENGMLGFITPQDQLNPGQSYTLTVSNAVDTAGIALPYTSITFTVGGTDTHDQMRMNNNNSANPRTNQLPDEEEWVPDAGNLQGNWRSRQPASPSESLPPLKANPGETALAGQVLTLTGKPLANVTLMIGHVSAQTDETGRFLLRSLAAGRQAMIIDGGTASKPNKPYAMFDTLVDIKAGHTNILPFKIWLPVIDRRNITRVPAPTPHELIATTPRMPGLEVHIPKGVYLKYPKGGLLSELTLTPIPVDRPPFPLPAGVSNGILFTLQMHGAKSSSMAGRKGDGIRIIYPNYAGQAPGTRIDLWNYDSTGEGWYVYGKGTVTADGRQIVPDPGAELQSMHCATFAGNAPPSGKAPGNWCVEGADPIDLSTGHFGYSKMDLFLPDVFPIMLTHIYRQEDTVVRSFGIGTTHPYDMFLAGADHSYMYADLILPDGGRIHYDRISPGTGMLDMVLENTTAPTRFYKSRIVFNGDGYTWDLTLKDGTLYKFFAPLGKLISIKDRNGNLITIERDYAQNHRINRIITNHGRWVEFTYDGINRITLAKDSIGRTIGYTYDTSGRLWKVTDVGAGVTEHTYDSSGRMLTIKDPRGIVYLTNEYDSNGRVIKQTLADDTPNDVTDNPKYQLAYTVDGSGRITQTDLTDPRGYVRRVTFNSSGYTVTHTDALGMPEQKTITYERQSASNFVQGITDQLGQRTEYSYDAAGNLTASTNFASTTSEAITSITYDPTFNQATSETDPLNHTTNYGYDSRGNMTSVTDALGHQMIFGYDLSGRLMTLTDALQHTTQFIYENGDLVEVKDPLNRSVKRYVDGAGRVGSITNAMGVTSRYVYDVFNQLKKIIDPLQGETSLSYDQNGNLLSVTDARGKVIAYTYDSLDRVLTRTDQLQGASSVDRYEYDKAGNIAKLTDRRGKVTTFNYNALNRTTFAGFGTAGATYESTISYVYDGYNRVTQAIDSSSGTVTRSYDDLARTVQETTPQGAITYAYGKSGRPASMTVSGQAEISYTYDNADRLTGISKGSNNINFIYDDADRRTSMTLPNGVVTEYGYDDASEPTSLTYKNGGGSVLGQLTYEYDRAGRRIRIGGSYSRTLMPQAFSSVSFNDANRMLQREGVSYTYDANGNLTNDGTNTFTWNARNQLTGISGGIAASFQYDAFGRRTNKIISGIGNSYLYDGGNVVQELSGTTPLANMLNGGLDELLMRNDSNGTSSYLRDGLNGTLALADQTGTLQSQYTYDPFGKTQAEGIQSSNSNQYTGRDNDQTGLYYYRARYYSPALQRFVSEDPVGTSGGINLYAYVGNDPINFSDPQGLWPSKGALGVGGHIHQGSAANVLGSRLSPEELSKLQQGLYDADWDPGAQDVDQSARHAMTPMIAGRGDKAETRREANRLFRQFIQEARAAAAVNPLEGMRKLGYAMHIMQDYTSPAHYGFQMWDGSDSYRHFRRENFNPGANSQLDLATELSYHYYRGRPFPEDVFSELSCDCPLGPTIR
jgi:RHS repeat-associated protein